MLHPAPAPNRSRNFVSRAGSADRWEFPRCVLKGMGPWGLHGIRWMVAEKKNDGPIWNVLMGSLDVFRCLSTKQFMRLNHKLQLIPENDELWVFSRMGTPPNNCGHVEGVDAVLWRVAITAHQIWLSKWLMFLTFPLFLRQSESLQETHKQTSQSQWNANPLWMLVMFFQVQWSLLWKFWPPRGWPVWQPIFSRSHLQIRNLGIDVRSAFLRQTNCAIAPVNDATSSGTWYKLIHILYCKHIKHLAMGKKSDPVSAVVVMFMGRSLDVHPREQLVDNTYMPYTMIENT